MSVRLSIAPGFAAKYASRSYSLTVRLMGCPFSSTVCLSSSILYGGSSIVSAWRGAALSSLFTFIISSLTRNGLGI